jgi:phage I-like protein
VPIATLSALQTEHASVQGQLAALNAEISGGKVAALVADGLAAGKLTPATKGWAEGLGKKDPEALTAFLDAAPVVMQARRDAERRQEADRHRGGGALGGGAEDVLAARRR